MDAAANTGDRAVAQQLTIVNRKGLHARASARFVRTAECFDAAISVIKDGTSVNG
ncbi:MAG TPA: HPr family phosphocarrier protein, partial [Devosia sp.]|nr:HPr family phosphocarrier protein [Devosia sp.]